MITSNIKFIDRLGPSYILVYMSVDSYIDMDLIYNQGRESVLTILHPELDFVHMQLISVYLPKQVSFYINIL